MQDILPSSAKVRNDGIPKFSSNACALIRIPEALAIPMNMCL
jgi:hypothetical protein